MVFEESILVCACRERESISDTAGHGSLTENEAHFTLVRIHHEQHHEQNIEKTDEYVLVECAPWHLTYDKRGRDSKCTIHRLAGFNVGST